MLPNWTRETAGRRPPPRHRRSGYARRIAVTDTTLRLDRARLASRGATLYQVDALAGGDVVATSPPDALTTSP